MSICRGVLGLVAVLAGVRCQLPEQGLGDDVADAVSDFVSADVTDEGSPAADASSDAVFDAADSAGQDADAGFLPADVPGLALWLRGDLGITLQTGVVAWSDSSGSGDPAKNVNQASVVTQPSYNSADNGYNGHPTVAFSNAASQTLVSGNWAVPLSQPFSVFVVGNLDGSTAPQMLVSSSLGSDVIELFSNNGNAGVGIYAGSFIYGSFGPSGAPQVYGGIFANGTSAVFQSALTATGTGGVVSGFMLTNTTLGSLSGGKFLNGKLAEVTIYSGVIGSNDLAALMNYFGARYGLSIGP